LLPVTVEIDLAKGNVYLYVAACDITSRRLDTLEISYHVAAPQRLHETKASQ
jgi:hypothetical protein